MLQRLVYRFAVVAFSLRLSRAAKLDLQTCPLLAAQYPSPVDINKQPTFQAAVSSIEATFNKSLHEAPYNVTSFSIGMFNLNDDGLVYQYHHTDALLAHSAQGTNSVDADSIYRIGSISKLLTVYLFLISQGDRRLNDPITEYVPELNELEPSNSTTTLSIWADITIGDLMGQMAGLSRDYGLADLAAPDNINFPPTIAALFPQVSQTDVPVCGYQVANQSYIGCSEEEYTRGVAAQTPIFPTAYTPVYSNEAFALLGMALTRITGKPMEQLFDELLVHPLALEGTSYNVPETVTEHDIIPDTQNSSNWDSKLGVFSPAGGYFSSTNDFATIGKSILNSTLISAARTRRWLKPSSFVNGLNLGVGRPWEINRFQNDDNHTVDIYTKAGDWGAYHTFFALIPDYSFGFSILTAVDPGSSVEGDLRLSLANTLFDSIIPALDSIAKSQATANFAGTYTSSTTNSSLTITTDDKAALKVSSWINNGSDIYNDVFELFSPDIDWRILPNMLYTGDKAGFTSFYQSPQPADVLPGPCFGWVDVDELTLGNVPVGHLVFETDEDGKAMAVELKALRARLERQT